MIEKYRAFAELSSDFTFILSKAENGRYILEWLSEDFTTLTGCSSTNLTAIKALIPEKSLVLIKSVLEKLKPGETTTLDFALPTKTGETCWLNLRMHCRPTCHHHRKQIIGVAKDITIQKQKQQEQEHLTHNLQVLNHIQQLLLSANPLTETLQSVLRLLKLLIPYSHGDIIEYDWLTEELHFIASTNKQYTPLIHENRLPLCFVDYPHTLPWHDVISIPDLANQDTLSPLQRIQRTRGIRSLMVAPLYNQQTLFGLISIGSHEPNAFLFHQHTLFLEVAHLIALRIQQTYLKHEQTDHALQLEVLVDQRTTDLKELIDQLEQSNRMKDEFLAAISHELRTPLHLILGKAEVLQSDALGTLNAKQQRAATIIQKNGDRLLKLINNLLDMFNLDTNQVALSLSPVDLQLLCTRLSMIMRHAARKKRIKLEVDALTQPIKIVADESRLEQILLILLDNAIKFTLEGGKVGLNIALDTARSIIRFEVWDTGIGIAADVIDLIFLPFKQLDGRLSRKYGGTGLGLPLAYRLTQLHDGTLSVISEVDQGSRFSVSLPLEIAQTSEEGNSHCKNLLLPS